LVQPPGVGAADADPAFAAGLQADGVTWARDVPHLLPEGAVATDQVRGRPPPTALLRRPWARPSAVRQRPAAQQLPRHQRHMPELEMPGTKAALALVAAGGSCAAARGPRGVPVLRHSGGSTLPRRSRRQCCGPAGGPAARQCVCCTQTYSSSCDKRIRWPWQVKVWSNWWRVCGPAAGAGRLQPGLPHVALPGRGLAGRRHLDLQQQVGAPCMLGAPPDPPKSR